MKRWNRFETFCKRQLSRSPRLKSAASAVRRRLAPAWRRGLAAAHWDDRVADVESDQPQGWLDLEMIEEEYIRPRISGDPAVPYLQHFFDRHVPNRPVDRLLSLGCGGGNLERALVDMGIAQRIDAYDESPGSIELARRMADEAGLSDRIRYGVADANVHELEAGVYDVVVIKAALHHFENLEHVYAQVHRSLKPGGLLMFNEFVGPSRFQWTDLQLDLMNRLLGALPESIRKQAPVIEIRRPLVADMIALDPSESVRSAEILPLLERDFEVLELKPYGGALLHILLSHVLPLMDLEDENHRSILRLLMLYEGSLVDHGVLPSDFAYAVARPR